MANDNNFGDSAWGEPNIEQTIGEVARSRARWNRIFANAIVRNYTLASVRLRVNIPAYKSQAAHTIDHRETWLHRAPVCTTPGWCADLETMHSSGHDRLFHGRVAIHSYTIFFPANEFLFRCAANSPSLLLVFFHLVIVHERATFIEAEDFLSSAGLII